jgi:predicted nucleic acid-binding protein
LAASLERSPDTAHISQITALPKIENLGSLITSSRSLNLATCSITELGFLRVASQAPAYGFAVSQARTLLERFKRVASSRFVFLPDAHDISHLPNWVRTPKQITGGHLAQLAKANGATLATLDEKIPGSYLIPR